MTESIQSIIQAIQCKEADSHRADFITSGMFERTPIENKRRLILESIQMSHINTFKAYIRFGKFSPDALVGILSYSLVTAIYENKPLFAEYILGYPGFVPHCTVIE